MLPDISTLRASMENADVVRLVHEITQECDDRFEANELAVTLARREARNLVCSLLFEALCKRHEQMRGAQIHQVMAVTNASMRHLFKDKLYWAKNTPPPLCDWVWAEEFRRSIDASCQGIGFVREPKERVWLKLLVDDEAIFRGLVDRYLRNGTYHSQDRHGHIGERITRRRSALLERTCPIHIRGVIRPSAQRKSLIFAPMREALDAWFFSIEGEWYRDRPMPRRNLFHFRRGEGAQS